MNRVLLFQFNNDDISENLLYEIIIENLNFNPSQIEPIINTSKVYGFSKNTLKKALNKDKFGINIYNDEYSIVTAYNFTSDLWSLAIDLLPNQGINYEAINKLCCNLKEFNSCFIYDFSDMRWQSEISIDNYNYFKKKHEHLKRINHPVWGESIDISKNPGRIFRFPKGAIIAASEMWIGKQLTKTLGRNNILKLGKRSLFNFWKAKDVKELMDGCFYIKLFDLEDEDSTKKNREIQKIFLDNLNIWEKELLLE